MEKMNISTLVDEFKFVRDTYKSKYNSRKKDYDKEIGEIKRDFNPKTKRYMEEIAKAKRKFQNDIDKQKAELSKYIISNINELREIEYLKVRNIDSVAMEKLEAISNLPLTEKEISVLQNRFAPNGEYWVMRMIGNMAEKNGLNPSQFLHSATLDTKLDILEQLENQLNQLFDKFNGEVKYNTEVLLADAVLLKAERTYTNGYVDSAIEEIQIANRLYIQLKSKSAAEQSIGLSNVLSNATDNVKRALFYEITKDNSGIKVNKEALQWSGYYEEYEKYLNNEHKKYSKAREGYSEIIKSDNVEDVEKIANKLNDNLYFEKMMAEAQHNNIYISEYRNTKKATKEAKEIIIQTNENTNEVSVHKAE